MMAVLQDLAVEMYQAYAAEFRLVADWTNLAQSERDGWIRVAEMFRHRMTTEYVFDELLWCPFCHARHIDEGAFEHKPHHTHACQSCGFVWRPAKHNTRGVRFLPGFGPKE